MLRLATLVPFLILGCAEGGDGDFASDGAPLIGVDGSLDQADRNCHVVLRDLERSGSGFWLETQGSSWVWVGTVEISEAAANEGLVPSAMFRMAPNGAWSTVHGTVSQAAATPGFVRYALRMHDGLPGPGWSGTSLSNARIEVVPFIAMPHGGRLFDHNRNTGDLDNYVMALPDFAIWSNATVCAPPAGPTRARLVFEPNFTHHREGVLAPGGELTVVYDPSRLSQCRHSSGGNALYDITAHVRFEPGQQRRDISVRDAAATMAVPSDARRAVLWFENTSSVGCQAWDSNLGNNYVFDALVPPQWIGDAQNLIARSPNDNCDGGPSASQGFAFDTWARQRASHTNACFQVYEPGLTDRDDPELWQKLDAQIHYRFAGQTAWTTQHVAFDRRVGNNARYAFGLRGLDPFRAYHCPEVAGTPTADGFHTQIQLEYFFTVNGGELRPQPGAAFAGTFADYVNDAWRDANCN